MVRLCVMIAGAFCTASAYSTEFHEVEPNNGKAAANIVTLGSGDGISGTTTGASNSAGLGSLDYFRVRTSANRSPIYRHRLIQTAGSSLLSASLRGLNQTGGVIGTADVTLQSGAGTPKYVQWYGFGRMEQIYFRVEGASATTDGYRYELSTNPVSILAGPTNLQSGMITIGRAGHSTDTDFWVYDAAYNAIPDYGNDDPNLLTRSFAPGSYLLAVSNWNFANDRPAASGETFPSGHVTDYPNVIVNSSNATDVNVSMRFTDAFGVYDVAATRAQMFEVVFISFTVVAPTVACCFSDTTCTQVTSESCAAAGGTPQAGGSQCGTTACPDTNPGQNCNNPIEIAVPAALPFEQANTTFGKRDDDTFGCLGAQVQHGEDIHYRLTVSDPTCVEIRVTNRANANNIDCRINSVCPQPNQAGGCIFLGQVSPGVTESYGLQLSPGIYWLLIDQRSEPVSADFYLQIRQCTVACCLAPGDSCTTLPASTCAQLGGIAAGGPCLIPESTRTYTRAPGLHIADFTTVEDAIYVFGLDETVSDVDVKVTISHTSVFDLEIKLEHLSTTVWLWDNQCGWHPGLSVTFDDEGVPVGVTCPPLANVGTIAPHPPTPPRRLSAFNGLPAGGEWTLQVTDNIIYDSGSLQHWSLILTTRGSCIVTDKCEDHLVGDANCDGVVNNFDINFFVAALIDGPTPALPPDVPPSAPASYLNLGGSEACWYKRRCWGDVDCDSVFNNFDIDPFVECIVNTPPPGQPCPSCPAQDCCLPNGGCATLSPAACTLIGGLAPGTESGCTAAMCP